MSITVTFADPLDSPTGASPLRIRYALDAGRVRLHYAHGAGTLDAATWAAWAASGATLACDTDAERRRVAEVLGDV